MTTEQKIQKFHTEEIKLILFICSTDLSSYDDRDLECFAEDIEGRIDILFEPNYLLTLRRNLRLTVDAIQDFQTLKELLQSYFSSQWHNKMKDNDKYWDKINVLGKSILKKLDIDWVEPNLFKQKHLDIDWT